MFNLLNFLFDDLLDIIELLYVFFMVSGVGNSLLLLVGLLFKDSFDVF